MRGKTVSVWAALSLAAATCAAATPENPNRSAIKGCLIASPSGTYHLTDDDTGTIYNLVGSSEALGTLVGADVLVTGSRLAAHQAPVAPSRDDRVGGGRGSNEMFESEPPAENSFRVTSAVKFNDLCVLSSASKARVPASRSADPETLP